MLPRLATVVFAATTAVMVSSKAHPEWVTIEEYIGETIAQSVTDAVQRAADLAAAKADANAEYHKARLAFYAQLESGVLGSPEEQRFAVLLYQKDIYYLSLNASGGVRANAKIIRAVDALSGGQALDGGIDLYASDLFDIWVNDVRAKLGAKQNGELIMPTSQAQLMQAIAKLSDSYNRYRKARDRLEFLRWRASRPLIYAPKATTPEARADTYIHVVLEPTIETEVTKLPEDQRDSSKQKLDAWVIKLRQAIIDYETLSLTPEDVAEAMKSWKFSESDIAYFWTRLGEGKKLQGNDFLVAVEQALAQTQNFRDLRQYGHQFNSRPAAWDSQLKFWNLKRAGKLYYEEVYKTQPVKFARVTYHEVGDAIANGRLGSEPPLPVFRRYGDEPKPQLKAASALALPETKSEPERLASAAAAAKANAAIDAQALKDQRAVDQETKRAEADRSVRAAAAAYLRGEKSGLDVLGVRLGMSVDEADDDSQDHPRRLGPHQRRQSWRIPRDCSSAHLCQHGHVPDGRAHASPRRSAPACDWRRADCADRTDCSGRGH